MGIRDKQTYGEYHGAMQLEAQEIFAEDVEKELASIASSLMGSLRLREFLPEELTPLFDQLEAPAGKGLGDVGGRFISEIADGAVSKAASPFFESMGYLAYNISPTKKMTPVSTATLFSRRKINEDFFLERFRMGGFEPIEAKFQYDSMRAYPSIPELITYSRYHGDPENVWGTLQEFFDVDPVDFRLWDWLSLQKLTTVQAQTLYKRGAIDEQEFYSEIARIGWHGVDRDTIKDLSYLIPNAMLLVQGDLFQDVDREKILQHISMADIHPDYAQTYLDAVLTKPASIDLVNYMLRQDPQLSQLPAELQKIGIHPDYTDVYKTLAYQIPPVADIITMAVREAFSPEIAERFGQYQDFPPDFGHYAAMKGLTEDWAKRYWAAHWALPSPQQGFEMLHRGVINVDELNMLLRAQDVMPFWRDKLVQIAYRTLTRVDVRRMYALGVLDESEIVEAYLQHGYNDENARRMATFTVKQTLATQSKFTSGDIVKAFTQRMISRSDALGLLDLIGVKPENAQYIISTAEYKRLWEFTEQQIAGVRNLYRKKEYDENAARRRLAELNLPSDQIEVLMKQWWFEVKAELGATWSTAQTLSFLKKKLISQERAVKELTLNGYDTEHIEVYLRSLQ